MKLRMVFKMHAKILTPLLLVY